MLVIAENLTRRAGVQDRKGADLRAQFFHSLAIEGVSCFPKLVFQGVDDSVRQCDSYPFAELLGPATSGGILDVRFLIL